MSEQEIRNLKAEMIALTKSVNDAIEIAKKSAEVAYVASDSARKLGVELKSKIEEINIAIKPMSEIYTNVTGFKNVGKYIFYFVSILVAFAVSLKTLFPNFSFKLW